MKYHTYKLNLELITRNLRKNGLVSKRLKGNEALLTAARILHEYNPMGRETMDFIIQTEEWHWLTTERLVYYPGSLDLSDSMMRAKFSARDGAAFFDGSESFILAFPADLRFAGRPAHGCLITISHYDRDRMDHLKKFATQIGLPEATIQVPPRASDYIITINYNDHGNRNAYARQSVESNWVARYLACDSVDEYIAVCDELNEFEYLGGIALNEDEHAYNYEMLRFVLRFLMYKKALPERIIEGMPGVHRKEIEGEFSMNRTHKIIQPPRHRSDSPAAHYRSWHFRQLSHEKFYKGEHEHLTPGSRVVFVSDAYVGQKTTPMTVT